MSLVKPNRPPLISLVNLAAHVEDGARLSVGGHHFARLPIGALRAIVEAGVKNLRYFAWAGGLPLELLLEAEAVAEIDICFPVWIYLGWRRVFAKRPKLAACQFETGQHWQ